MDKAFKRIIAGWLAVMLAILVVGGGAEDYRSCQRQVLPRTTVRAQLDDQVELQTALSSWDDGHDKHLVELDGRWVHISRPQLRQWYAERTRRRAAALRVDCSSFPPGQ